jgi:hypothetical protein
MAVRSRSGAIRAGIWEIVSSKVFAEMHKTAVLARLVVWPESDDFAFFINESVHYVQRL